MPTLYPKCAPSEMLGFLVLLNTHRGSVEIARMAEEESMGMDKLLPAIEYAQGLGLVTVSDGKVAFTDSGRMLIAADIRVRKDLLRELLKRTILFRAILRSIDQTGDGVVHEDELHQIVAFTTAPPEAVQDIINWGRYTGIFRYDANQHAILPAGPGHKIQPTPAIALPAASIRPNSNHSNSRPPAGRSAPASPPRGAPKPVGAAKSPAPTVAPAGSAATNPAGRTSELPPKKKAPPPA